MPQVTAAEEVVDLHGLGDLAELRDRRIGRLARLPPQHVDVRAVIDAEEGDLEEPGELLADARVYRGEAANQLLLGAFADICMGNVVELRHGSPNG